MDLICFSFDIGILNPICFVLVIKQIRFAFWAFVLVIKHHYLHVIPILHILDCKEDFHELHEMSVIHES